MERNRLSRLRALSGSDTGRAAELGIAAMVANVVGLAFTLVFTRLLGQSGYGSLGALISTFLILTVAGYALQTTVAREVSGAIAAGEPAGRGGRGWLRRLGALAGGLPAGGPLARRPLPARVGGGGVAAGGACGRPRRGGPARARPARDRDRRRGRAVGGRLDAVRRRALADPVSRARRVARLPALPARRRLDHRRAARAARVRHRAREG